MSKLNNQKVVKYGIKFASQMECDFYDFLLSKYSSEDIIIQPKFILQETFKKNGQTHRAITYTADFQIKSNKLLYDVKGFTTIEFKIKQKLFEFKYPELNLCLITKCPKWLEKKYGI
jgi:hypothetical protein